MMEGLQLEPGSVLYPSQPTFLHTPKRSDGLGYPGSAFTSSPSLTSLQPATPHNTSLPTPRFADFTPSPEERGGGGYWAESDTPGRTLLSERLQQKPISSPFVLTPERQPLDYMTPERGRSASGPESGKRGRPRADMVNNLILEGSQSGNPIKCHICSR